MDFLRNVMNGIGDAWRGLSVSARINLALAGLAVVLFIGFVVYTNSRPQYVTLSTNVASSELGQIVQLLEDNQVPYQLSDNNRTVMVPLARRSELQLLLAENELPVGRRDEPGFELFAQQDFTSNQFQQEVAYQRAIQGSLQRLLNDLDFVEYSNVLIREAEEELFSAEQRPSEAAVTLKLRRMPTPRETKAIVNMIARAGGPYLHAKNITIITTDGSVLHDPGDDEFASLASTKLEYRSELERQREQRLMEALRQMGRRGIVRVSASIDFDQKEVESRKVEEGTEISTYTRTVTSTSSEAPPEGAPGALANIPAGTPQAGGLTTSEEDAEEITNFEPSHTITRTRTDPGDVVQYEVAMIVEGNYETPEGAAEGAEPQYVGLSEDERTMFIDLAKAGVGSARELTKVTVHDMPFDIDRLPGAMATVEAAQVAETRAMYTQWGLYGAQILGIIVLFLLARRFLRQSMAEPEEEEEEEIVIPDARPEPESVRRMKVQGEIERLAEQEAEMVSNLLRTWLTEEKE